MLSFVTDLRERIARQPAAADRTVWERVAGPDALVVLHLVQGDLAKRQSDIVKAYKVELNRGITPRELDSVLTQFEFLDKMLRKSKRVAPANALKEIAEELRKPDRG